MFEPGQRFSYNNAGFRVLGRLVEVFRGKPFDECVGRLRPCGAAAERALNRDVDVVPFATVPTPMFATDARFELTGNPPSSIRMLD